MKIRGFASKAFLLLRKYGGRIAYYGCVAVVLTAIALAAENYRQEGAEELLLPETETPALAQEQGAEPFVPNGMEILRPFSSLPEWNEGLRQWEAHTAVDCRFQDDRVPCLADGAVLTVGTSGLYGGFVELDCGDAIWRYACVEAREDLKPGTELKAGDEIGIAAASMPGEEALGNHIHLEILMDGKAVDYEEMRAKNAP